MDADEVEAALALDADWRSELQRQWIDIVRCAVFGAVAASRLGVLPKLRRRTLDTGEKLAALFAARDWIPHPRERLKNALASALALRESLVQLRQVLADLDRGADLQLLNTRVAELDRSIDARLGDVEKRWAGLLDAQLLDPQD